MRIAAFQFDVQRGDVPANLAQAESALHAAQKAGVELVLLPEMWSTSFMAEEELEPWLLASEEAVKRVRELSAELGVAVAGSSFGRKPGGRPFNSLQLFDGGERILEYRKVHLFSPTAEHIAFSAGSEPPAVVEWRGWKLAAGICYDLRFPGLWHRVFAEQAELILVSAQWPRKRELHWELLLRGRAVEHQAFFLGANRTGVDRVGRRQMELQFPGNSMLVSPHGKLLATGTGSAGLVIGEIDGNEMRALRRALPVRKDERQFRP
jgi:omega-amidase